MVELQITDAYQQNNRAAATAHVRHNSSTGTY